jgi:hypothetical protein
VQSKCLSSARATRPKKRPPRARAGARTAPRVIRLLGSIALVLTLAGTAPAAAQTRARTLVTVKGRIVAFTQDNHFLAWSAPTPPFCNEIVHVRDLRHGSDAALTDPTFRRRMTCPDFMAVNRLALVGGTSADERDARALFTRFEPGGNSNNHWFHTASIQRPRIHGELATIGEDVGADDDLQISLAGDASFLGYAYSYAEQDYARCSGLPCPYAVQFGDAARIVNSDVESLDVPPVARLAAGGGRIAVLVRGALGEATSPHPELRTVEVYDHPPLALKSRITVGGRVRSLALSDSTVAVLTHAAVERYSLDGNRISQHAVPAAAGPELALAGTRIVYRVGREIRLLGRPRPLAVAASRPIGLSIEGRRVAWAENVPVRGRVRGRIRAVYLP